MEDKSSSQYKDSQGGEAPELGGGDNDCKNSVKSLAHEKDDDKKADDKKDDVSEIHETQ